MNLSFIKRQKKERRRKKFEYCFLYSFQSLVSKSFQYFAILSSTNNVKPANLFPQHQCGHKTSNNIQNSQIEWIFFYGFLKVSAFFSRILPFKVSAVDNFLYCVNIDFWKKSKLLLFHILFSIILLGVSEMSPTRHVILSDHSLI